MLCLFEQDESLNRLSIGNWDTSKVTNMGGMFEGASSLSQLNISNWDTSQVTDMGGMFNRANSLIQLNLSNWDTSKVTDMSYMFAQNWNLLTIGDLSKWNTSKVTDMSYMFTQNRNLRDIGNISDWDTGKVTNMSYIFNNSGLNLFYASDCDNGVFKNQLKLMDQQGNPIALIPAPTFYKKIDKKTESEIVYETILPLVQERADKEYQEFRNGLTDGMKLIYPDKVTIKNGLSNF